MLDSGLNLEANKVVLVLGNYAPADPRLEDGDTAFFNSPRYVRDPWQPDTLWAAKLGQPVLLIGTDLTMLDVVMSLRARGVTALIHALSWHGLLPQAHRELKLPSQYGSTLTQQLAQTSGLRDKLRAVRRCREHGINWRDVVGSLRSATPSLWQGSPPFFAAGTGRRPRCPS